MLQARVEEVIKQYNQELEASEEEMKRMISGIGEITTGQGKDREKGQGLDEVKKEEQEWK